MPTPYLQSIRPGDALPERDLVCGNVQLFLYNAALWNPHRIHFDAPYAREVEGYPGLVVAGPLMGDWLTQCVLEWLGDGGELLSFEFSNRRAAYAGDPLVSGGRVASVDLANGEVHLELHLLNVDGEVVTPGLAVVRLPVG
jgi:3-methylfumaryl-CoA hydratase